MVLIMCESNGCPFGISSWNRAAFDGVGHERVDVWNYETFIESGPIGRWLFEECEYRRVMGLHSGRKRKNPSEICDGSCSLIA